MYLALAAILFFSVLLLVGLGALQLACAFAPEGWPRRWWGRHRNRTLLFYGFWLFAAYTAQAFLANPGNQTYFEPVLSPSLLIVFLYWQITPVITATMGASLVSSRIGAGALAIESSLFHTAVSSQKVRGVPRRHRNCDRATKGSESCAPGGP